ncbi:MAG: hypothetical protein KTQ49_01160 [Candidatus Omnitrophica bacterium]|nr:hypothetical protein [Candidatus Omnitrophota bacterium]
MGPDRGSSFRLWFFLAALLSLLPDSKAWAMKEGGFSRELERIGELIFQNECSGNDKALLTWNEGEQFPSLGIGHFIWYPRGYEGPFDESFPKLLLFMEERGVVLPEWFEALPERDAPWKTRADFLKDRESGAMDFLKVFLKETKQEQVEFLVERFRRSVPLIYLAASPDSRAGVQRKLYLMLRTRGGLYPLVDYVNFNGEGILESERYQGQGWGLLQVLEEMQEPLRGSEAVIEFVRAAETILERRIAHAPLERNEARWLPGWKARVRTYLGIEDPAWSSGACVLRGSLLSGLGDPSPISEGPALPLEEALVSPALLQ